MLAAISVFALLAFTLVMSQPLFFAFAFALGRASLALSGPAYAELRQRINVAITRTRYPKPPSSMPMSVM